MSKLFAKTINTTQVSDQMKQDMFILFDRYYDNVNKEKFISDFNSKDKVIILRDKTGLIRGFSTIKELKIELESEVIWGIFSGDTVIDLNFWGGSELAVEFFKNVLKAKAKHPFCEVYWFLISKGYKTYLLLANNFKTYYPRYDKDTPERHQKIIKQFGTNLFGRLYQSDKFLLSSANMFDRLKQSVAPISDSLLKCNPKIAYFQKMNPHWQEGDELCCIGRVDFGLITQFTTRTFSKQLKKRASLMIKER